MFYVKIERRREGRYLEGEVLVGTTITEALREAYAFACKMECGVTFDFNGLPMYLHPGQDLQEAEACYWACQRLLAEEIEHKP